MFEPKYTITNHLVKNVARIHSLVTELNNRRFPSVVLLEFERQAREVSTYASTHIEGNPLPLTEVKSLLKNHSKQLRDTEKEVVNYNNALEHLNEMTKKGEAKLTERLILDIQRRVTKELLPESESGYYRQSPVVVNDPRSGGVVYMPPDISEVAQLVQELLMFIHSNHGNIDPLLLAGIFHKQFVLIHPFTDGNGRTTRLATKVLLADMGLDTFNLFSFENFYNQNVTKYFGKVGEFGDWYEEQQDGIDFTTWLEYFTDGIIDELLRVKDHLPNAATPKTTLQLHDNVILDIIDKNGYATDSDYAERTDRSKASRTLDFNKLIKLGLIEREGGGRSTHYVRTR